MDPLILIIEEVDRMRRDIEKLEDALTDCEFRIDFRKDDPRYVRLTTEKDLLLKNLCDIRKELCQKGECVYAEILAKEFVTSVISFSCSNRHARKCDICQER